MPGFADATRCVLQPPFAEEGYRSLTVPVHRASTIVFPDAQAYQERAARGPDGYTYGLHGTPTARALEARIAALEGGVRALVVPSGLAAMTMAMATLLAPGDGVLVPDSVYPPVRDFAEGHLRRIGVDVRYYDPLAGAGIAALMRDATRLVLVESPGSTTMEVQDLPAIVAAARRVGALVACDNTWATPLLCKPLALGADLSIEAVSKYMGGHSDLLMGSIAVRDMALFARLKDGIKLWGLGVSPDECSLALRGLETMEVRLSRAGAQALALAEWLQGRPGIAQVLHPALPGSPGHAAWRRDFRGASGVFSLVFTPEAASRLPGALAALRLFAIGASWGGTRSLVAPMDVRSSRTIRPWTAASPLLRLSIGLEAPEDLRADLEAMLAKLA